MVRVLPKNDAIRKLIKHPVGGPFRAEGAAEWPSDSFTARRIADGDVTAEKVEAKEDPQAEQKDDAQLVEEEKKEVPPVDEKPVVEEKTTKSRSRT